VIAHVDMDAFYVAVELLRRPELRGKPVIVATGTDPAARGVVMTASYEARRFGVHSALPLATAHRRCPQAILLPRDMEAYQAQSRQVMSILRGYSDTIEVAGLDEAYLDLSGSMVPTARARELKRDVLARTRLTCSVGLAENKLLAKIASDLEKPDGLCVLRAEQMLKLVGERPATLIPGVGPKTAERLQAIGVRTVAELAAADLGSLRAAIGPSLGEALHDRANGIDDRGLETDRERKSESRETTFSADVTDRVVLLDAVDRLARSVCKGLAAEGWRGRTVTLKIRLRPFRTHTRSRTIEAPTRDPDAVAGVARELLERFDPDAPVRLVGVGMAGLVRDQPENGRGPARATPAAGEHAAGPLSLDLGLT
jgi:DNA polymerase IV